MYNDKKHPHKPPKPPARATATLLRDAGLVHLVDGVVGDIGAGPVRRFSTPIAPAKLFGSHFVDFHTREILAPGRPSRNIVFRGL
jgi:hypothetical protein